MGGLAFLFLNDYISNFSNIMIMPSWTVRIFGMKHHMFRNIASNSMKLCPGYGSRFSYSNKQRFEKHLFQYQPRRFYHGEKNIRWREDFVVSQFCPSTEWLFMNDARLSQPARVQGC